MIAAAPSRSPSTTPGIDLDLLFEIADYWEEVRKRKALQARHLHPYRICSVYSHQVPGGMMSNLVSQLEIQKADRPSSDDVLEEIPARARRGRLSAAGHALCRQIVGTQAVFNVLTGKRWSRRLQGDEGLPARAITARRPEPDRPQRARAASWATS